MLGLMKAQSFRSNEFYKSRTSQTLTHAIPKVVRTRGYLAATLRAIEPEKRASPS